MKNPLYIFLGLGMIFIWSCSDEIETTNDFCTDDYAEYYYNDILFRTTYLPDKGEILTPSGENCGIGAAINESVNILTLRIFGEGQELNIHAEITNLNEEGAFRFLQYTNSNISSTFNNLILDNQNYILIEELDTLANTIKGAFNFKIENSIGDTISVTNGLFNCSYHGF